jgi:hypothetical protein
MKAGCFLHGLLTKEVVCWICCLCDYFLSFLWSFVLPFLFLFYSFILIVLLFWSLGYCANPSMYFRNSVGRHWYLFCDIVLCFVRALWKFRIIFATQEWNYREFMSRLPISHHAFSNFEVTWIFSSVICASLISRLCNYWLMFWTNLCVTSQWVQWLWELLVKIQLSVWFFREIYGFVVANF